MAECCFRLNNKDESKCTDDVAGTINGRHACLRHCRTVWAFPKLFPGHKVTFWRWFDVMAKRMVACPEEGNYVAVPARGRILLCQGGKVRYVR